MIKIQTDNFKKILDINDILSLSEQLAIKWTKVKDKKPLSTIDVLFRDRSGKIYYGYYDCYKKWRAHPSEISINNVIYWAEKPYNRK